MLLIIELIKKDNCWTKSQLHFPKPTMPNAGRAVLFVQLVPVNAKPHDQGKVQDGAAKHVVLGGVTACWFPGDPDAASG